MVMSNPYRTEGGAMTPRYRVTLSPEERSELEAITRDGKTRAKRFRNARALPER